MASFGMLWVLPSLAALAGAVPVVYFPFNSQLPPATRISEPFSYTLSPQTFASQSRISYTLQNSPKWLSIDSSTGRLFGTPQDADVQPGEVVGIPVDIVATDDSGSATMTATLVVTRNPAPKINIPLSEQIQQLGETSSPSAVVAYPASEFSFSFAKDTFSYPGNGINYYATSANNSPLPSWIKFDAASLTFSGTTPPFESLVQPPQKFDFSLVGSDIVGFSAVSITFSIVVGAHRLTSDTPVIEINATRGTELAYEALAGSIKLDGNPVSPSELNFTTSELPDWLSVDSTTLVLRGTPPTDAQSVNTTITFRDVYQDNLDILLSIFVTTRIFRDTTLQFEITPGEDFSFDLEPYLWTPSDTELELSNSRNWIELDGLKIAGTAPDSLSSENTLFLVKATSKSTGESETVVAEYEVLPAAATPSEDPTPSASPTRSAATDAPSQGLNPGLIALAVLLPLLALFAAVLLIVCCRRRRQRESKKKREISEPIPGSFVWNGSRHSRETSNPSIVEIIKKPEVNRRGSRGYFNSAVARMRQSTLSTITGSRMSQSLNRSSSLWRGSRSDRDNMPTSPSLGSSWQTEGVYFHPQHSHQASTSTYDGPGDVLSTSSGFLQGQRDDSFRSVLDVTIPAAEDEASSIQATPDLAYTSPWGEPSRLALDRSAPLLGPSGSDSLASIPEQPTPLGSHPTHGKRFSPAQRPKKMFPLLKESRSRDSLRSSISGSGRGRFGRQDSQPGSWTGSVSRPISRKSDSSPFFGGRSVVPSRNRYNLDSDSDSQESVRGTENWQTIPRDSLGIAYAELTQSSPFLKHTSSLSPRPLSIIKKESSGTRYGSRDSRIGKQRPLSRRTSSSSNGLSTSRWDRDSTTEQGTSANRTGYASSRASSEVLGKGKGLARYSPGPDSDLSDWVTEAGTVGKKGPRSRLDSSDDYRVFM
ncbi:polarity establishment/cellular polarization [Colletotrichum sojae]|uniref:Polarity establishment/cellular polarization n=1 Tax=Colletotrichum sojae TaxID=2175907 RepID=A0A8H6N3R4_9PEZI|nr:polarity establishment/cellular polarization [Colletotrichum sojae]